MPTKSLEGVIPVLSTPFKESGEVDFEVLSNEIRWIKSQGIDLVATGMVSEILKMNLAERELISEKVSEFAILNSMGSIVSCGQETIAGTIHLVNHAESIGASAVMINPPISTKLSENETFNFFAKVFEKTRLPIVVQDASGYVGNSIPLPVLVKLFNSYEDRIYFKPEAIPIGQRLSALRDATNSKARIFEGTGGAHLVDSFSRGVVGTMPGADICWAILSLWRALEQGNWQVINLINGAVANMVNLLPTLDAYVAIEKHLLQIQGVFANTLKKEPVAFSLDAETQKEAERIFKYLKELTI